MQSRATSTSSAGERSVEQVVSDLQSQFQEIKARYAKNPSWQSRSNRQIRTLLYTALATEYPDYHTATEIDCRLPDDNSCCERFVSLLNRIKSQCRSRLSIKLANWLMLIAANGPKFGEVDWLAILELWKCATRVTRVTPASGIIKLVRTAPVALPWGVRLRNRGAPRAVGYGNQGRPYEIKMAAPHAEAGTKPHGLRRL